MASGPGTAAITAARSPCSAAAELHYLQSLSVFFSAHIIHAPSSHRRPESQFLPLPWFSLHSFFSLLLFIRSLFRRCLKTSSLPAFVFFLSFPLASEISSLTLLSISVPAVDKRTHLPTSAVSKHALFRRSIVIPDTPLPNYWSRELCKPSPLR